ncbi:MAG: MBL fold metallo-hydrolase [Flavobacteriales bacterium]|nr:MBL fold metallo-hydrolase [Flavobacteriales bacterium]
MIRRILKRILTGTLVLILSIIIMATIFTKVSPQFGGSHSSADQERYRASGHYNNGKFENLISTELNAGPKVILGWMKETIKGIPNREPAHALPIEHVDSLTLVDHDRADRLLWFGHSAFLLQLEGKNILLDPMLGEVCAPHPWLGPKRYSDELPIELEKLPVIDAVIFSHDHYDHLDYPSVMKLKDKTKAFYVPLGVGAHLRSWGIEPDRVHELNWWETVSHEHITFTFTPSRHFSGRGMTDRYTTLWGGWVIKGSNRNIYFSGDSGYGPHFKETGEKFGPFDLALVECGQYNMRWHDIHMMPEESAQAAVDLNTKVMMPIHWGAFTLSLHAWNEPPTRLIKSASELNMPVITPKIGEMILLDHLMESGSKWW